MTGQKVVLLSSSSSKNFPNTDARKISFVKGGKVTPIQNINELKLLLGASFGEE